MKNQAFLSSKDKCKKLKCRLLQFLFGALSVIAFFRTFNQRKLLKSISGNICIGEKGQYICTEVINDEKVDTQSGEATLVFHLQLHQLLKTRICFKFFPLLEDPHLIVILPRTE